MPTSIRSILAHPITPIIAAALLTWGIPENLNAAKWALLFVSAWACVDLYGPVSARLTGSRWRSICLCLAFEAVGMGLILTYSFLLKNKFAIDEQQTFDSLKAQAYVSPADDPFYSVFTIANNGTQEIGKHRIGCHVNLVTGQHGGFLRNFNEIVTEFNTNLEPGGDADSSECLQAVVPADASA